MELRRINEYVSLGENKFNRVKRIKSLRVKLRLYKEIVSPAEEISRRKISLMQWRYES